MPPKKKQNDSSTREDLKSAEEVSLDEWLARVKELHAVPDAIKGACLVRSPNGDFNCVRTTSDACKAMGGTFVGGPCGAA
jgi:hypothetical protein